MELHPILERGEIPANSKMWYVIAAGGCNAPTMRVGHSGTSLPCKNATKVLILGGANPNGVFPENHLLNLGLYEWEKVSWSGLKGRYEHATFSPTTDKNKVFVFGGADQSGNLNDLQVLDLQTGIWSSVEVTGDAPSPRTCRGSAWLGDQLYVFSGGEQGADPVADSMLHVFNCESSSWKQPEVTGDVPKPRHGHATVAVGTKLYLHGGMARDTFYDDLYEFDTETSVWKQIQCSGDTPPGVAAHGAVAFKKKVVIFGGMTKGGASDTTYVLDTESFHWKKVELNGAPPASRLDHAMCVVTMASPMDLPSEETTSRVTDRAVTGIVDVTENAMFVVDGVQQDLDEGKEESRTKAEGPNPASPPVDNQLTDSGPRGATSLSTATDSCENAEFVSCLFVHGGMDVSGQIFDDCLVLRLDDL